MIDRLAYISDTNGIFFKDFSKLRGLKYLIIDCLKFNAHPSHFNLEQAVKIISGSARSMGIEVKD